MTRPLDSSECLPIVVVHAGLKPYLEICLRRAAESNPRGRVVLIGDDANAGLGIGEHHRLDDASLRADIAEFRAVYEHHSSSTSLRFERFCMERWFLVRNFMRRENLDRCLVIDSDVLLFCDVAEEAARFHDCAMTFARWDEVRLLPHCNFVGRRDAVESFCDYVLDLYRHPSRLSAVKALNVKKSSRHWVSDMSLFHDWTSRGDFRIGMLEDTLRNGVGYDDRIDHGSGFTTSCFAPGVLRRWKRIEYRDGIPYARHHDTADVAMKCLHFHGDFKALMARHARCQPDDWQAAAIMARRKLAKAFLKARRFAGKHLGPTAGWDFGGEGAAWRDVLRPCQS